MFWIGGHWCFSTAQATSEKQANHRKIFRRFSQITKFYEKKENIFKVDCWNFFACILNVNLESLMQNTFLWCCKPFVKFMLDMKWTKRLCTHFFKRDCWHCCAIFKETVHIFLKRLHTLHYGKVSMEGVTFRNSNF